MDREGDGAAGVACGFEWWDGRRDGWDEYVEGEGLGGYEGVGGADDGGEEGVGGESLGGYDGDGRHGWVAGL